MSHCDLRIQSTTRWLIAITGVLILLCAPAKNQEKKDESLAQGIPTFKKTTRLVVVDVVASDAHGDPVRDLTEKDFMVFEHLDWIRRVPQKIASFRAVHPAESAEFLQKDSKTLLSPDVYNNATVRRGSVPLTILLMDAVNTNIAAQLQAGQQMRKMLDQLPENVPVAIYLLTWSELRVLQEFTSDRALLRAAINKSYSVNTGEPEDRSFMPGSPHPQPSDSQSYAIRPVAYTGADPMKDRVKITIGAFRSLARHLSGYPTRKNLIWITDSFPTWHKEKDTWRKEDEDQSKTSYYSEFVLPAKNALANARVVVYPVAASGLTVNVDDDSYSSQGTMTYLADETGGRTCINTNDLVGCVKKAAEHGLWYYELSYHPGSSKTWISGFHRILVKVNRPGVRLSYRQGYDAYESGDSRPKPNPEKTRDKTKRDPDLQTAACGDLMTSTSLTVTTRAVQADRPGRAKYLVVVNSTPLTFIPLQDEKQKVQLDYAACTFDASGFSLQYMQDDMDQVLSASEYRSVVEHGFPHMVEFTPSKGMTQLRIVVRDAQTRLMGSVDLPLAP